MKIEMQIKDEDEETDENEGNQKRFMSRERQ